jgi:hypothetical protein
VDGRPQERFSFFVLVEDDDGIENLRELHLYHDWEGLEWILNSDDWVYHEENGRHWIGSRSIAMTGGDILPRGQYKARLINKGGEHTERSFTFDAPESPRYPFPTLHIAEGRYTVNSNYPVNSFIVYDQQGGILRTIPVRNMEGTVSEINAPGSARLAALWAQDTEYYTSALTEAVSLR